MSLGEILWLLLMGGILVWCYFFFFLTRYGKQSGRTPFTDGKWGDCQHQYGLLQHFFSDTCCAVNGHLHCNKPNFHKGHHYGLYADQEKEETPYVQ